MKIRLGSRQSHLARLQAYSVGDALLAAHPGLQIEYFFKESLGDKNQTDPLWKLPERGVFTEDFVSDLREGRTDLVVHSWKDLPTENRPGLSILGTLPRADTRDVLFLRRESVSKKNLKILTSSPRRTFAAARELPALLPFAVEDLTFSPVRGNILTRLRKLVEGEGDGLFMAKAALDRLLTAPREEFAEAKAEMRAYIARTRWMVMPLSLFPSAPAQGALAIEGAAQRDDLRELLRPLHCEKTAVAVNHERNLFSSFGGGCHQKIGLTVEEHPRLGTLEYFYGELDSGEVRHSLKASRSPTAPAATSRWPMNPAQAFFKRVPLPAEHPGTDLFVARAESLPENWRMGEELVWGAGTETWKKLASRGIWVHGCADGLGESNPPLAALAGREPMFTKLTHDRSANEGVFPHLATYRLENTDFSLPAAESYFWMSETTFSRALSLNPEIRHARHAAGPGYTAQAIERILGRPIEVYINYRHWKNGDPLGN
jgi:hydroxymethylbilane synthase